LDTDTFAAESLLAVPNGDPKLRAYWRGMAAAARLQDAEAIRQLAATARHVDPRMARHALETAGAAALRAGRYREAADLLRRALASDREHASPQDRIGLEQTRDVAVALAGVPSQTVGQLSETTLPLGISALGLTTLNAKINGHDQAAVIDTGANLSTLSESAAQALGVRFVGRASHVGSAATRSVASRMAVADVLRIGPVVLRHVAFLVLSDAALSPAGPEKRIDAILGFPVLSALGRITFAQTGGGRTLRIERPAPASQPGNLRFLGYDAFVRTRIGAEDVALFLDSGATRTSLGTRYAAAYPDRIAGLRHTSVKVGGAGGVDHREAVILPKLEMIVGGTRVALTDVEVELDGAVDAKGFGAIGADLLWARGGYTLDFRNLSLTLGTGP
jgi:predicted aspartyl protease